MTDIQKQLSTGPKEFIVLMATLMSVVAISIDAMLPALSVIGRDLGTTNPNQPQLIISFIFAGMAIGQLICGPLSDAFGRKKILYTGLFFYLIGSTICLFSTSIEAMLFGRFIQGLGVSGPYISTVSIVRDRFSGRAMAKIMSLVMMIFMMIPTIAPALGQGLMALGSWHYIFAMYVVYALVVTTWVFFRLDETLAPENRIPYNVKNIISGVKTVLGNRPTVCYIIATGAIFGALIGYLNSCAQIYQVQFGVGNLFALYFGLQALAIGVASLVNSRLVEKHGMRAISLRAIFGMLTISVLLLLVTSIFDVHFWMFFVYIAALLFHFGLLFGNLNALAMEPMGHLAGIASAIIGATSSIISIILGTTIGQLYNGTLTPMVCGFIALGVLALIFFMLAEKSRKTVPVGAE